MRYLLYLMYINFFASTGLWFTELSQITEINWKFRGKSFFFLVGKFNIKIGFRLCGSEFNGYRLIRIIVSQITVKLPNLMGNLQEKLYVFLFGELNIIRGFD